MNGLDITCGPHAQKRRGRDTITVSRPRRVLTDGARGWIVDGTVDQRVYVADGREFYDEDPLPYPSVAGAAALLPDRMPGDPSKGPVEVRDGPERQRTLIACPVCRNALTFREVTELWEVLDRLADGGARIMSLDGLRRARDTMRQDRSEPS